jgi:predicted small secreted protein
MDMKMHRFLPAVLLVLAFLMLVSACGGKGGGGY